MMTRTQRYALAAGGAALLGWFLTRRKRSDLGSWRRGTRKSAERPNVFRGKKEAHAQDEQSRDAVDEASWESFPASDSPAW